MSRVLLIGQAPGPRTDPDLPLFPVPKTSAGGRLVGLMGIRRHEYLSRFDRINLLPYFPGKHKRDDKFPMTPAKLAATVMRPLLVGRVVIFVGRNVANAFSWEGGFHEWDNMQARRRCLAQRCDGTAQVAIVPHPSGRNHWYNNEANRERAKAFWDEVVKKIEAGDRKLLSSDADERI